MAKLTHGCSLALMALASAWLAVQARMPGPNMRSHKPFDSTSLCHACPADVCIPQQSGWCIFLIVRVRYTNDIVACNSVRVRGEFASKPVQ